ncbi:DnaD domain-containing protein [Chloroflexota bacterium]
MEQQKGFPTRMEFTPIPNYFLSTVLPKINDIFELKITLYSLATLYNKRGYPRFITYKELLGNDGLISSFSGTSRPAEELLRDALEMATQRGTLIHIIMDQGGTPEDIYLINTEKDKQAAEKIQRGELILTGLKTTGQSYSETKEIPDIFTLYEQNIGMLTPTIADELREAEKLYPESWIRDAVREAVNQNVRKWTYISAILESWTTKGKSDGTNRRDSASKKDPDKYIKGKYGHVVRR